MGDENSGNDIQPDSWATFPERNVSTNELQSLAFADINIKRSDSKSSIASCPPSLQSNSPTSPLADTHRSSVTSLQGAAASPEGNSENTQVESTPPKSGAGYFSNEFVNIHAGGSTSPSSKSDDEDLVKDVVKPVLENFANFGCDDPERNEPRNISETTQSDSNWKPSDLEDRSATHQLEIEIQDIYILHYPPDFGMVKEFREDIHKKSNPSVKVILDEELFWINDRIDRLEFGMKKAAYTFIFITDRFKLEEFESHYCTNNILMATIKDTEKQYTVIPVFVNGCKNDSFALQALSGIYYYDLANISQILDNSLYTNRIKLLMSTAENPKLKNVVNVKRRLLSDAREVWIRNTRREIVKEEEEKQRMRVMEDAMSSLKSPDDIPKSSTSSGSYASQAPQIRPNVPRYDDPYARETHQLPREPRHASTIDQHTHTAKNIIYITQSKIDLGDVTKYNNGSQPSNDQQVDYRGDHEMVPRYRDERRQPQNRDDGYTQQYDYRYQQRNSDDGGYYDDRRIPRYQERGPRQNPDGRNSPQYQNDRLPPQNRDERQYRDDEYWRRQYRDERYQLQYREDRFHPQYRDDRALPQNRDDMHLPRYHDDRLPPPDRDDRGQSQNRDDRRLPTYDDDRFPPQNRDDRFPPPDRDDRGQSQNRDDRRLPAYDDDRFPPQNRDDRFPQENHDDRFRPQNRDDRFQRQNRDDRNRQYRNNRVPPPDYERFPPQSRYDNGNLHRYHNDNIESHDRDDRTQHNDRVSQPSPETRVDRALQHDQRDPRQNRGERDFSQYRDERDLSQYRDDRGPPQNCNDVYYPQYQNDRLAPQNHNDSSHTTQPELRHHEDRTHSPDHKDNAPQGPPHERDEGVLPEATNDSTSHELVEESVLPKFNEDL